MKKNQLILFFLFCFGVGLVAQPNPDGYDLVEVSGFNDTINYKFVQNQALYTERWDTLSQPEFWRTLMSMGDDSALINIASTRQVIRKIAVSDWNKLSKEAQTAIRDSVKRVYNLPEEAHVYMTSGKKSFYDFYRVIPTIGKGLKAFKDNNVDPFYAQAILLIESPNKLQKSPVGAHGSFQLMRKVAINLGLKVNKYVDERKDFDRSAWAASQLIKTICIPELNKILNFHGVKYSSDELWYKLLVLHVYHAGAGNVKLALAKINPSKGNMGLITTLWQTEAGGFRNASQNYSQLALASMLELNDIIYKECNFIFNCN